MEPTLEDDSLTFMVRALLSTQRITVEPDDVPTMRLAKLVLNLDQLHDAFGLADDVSIVGVTVQADCVRVLVTAPWFNDNGTSVPRVRLDYLR